MGLIIKKPDDAIIVNKKDGTHVAYYLFDEYDVNVNIKMTKKWKIKMYIFQDLFLRLCFYKGTFFFQTI